MRRTCIVSRGGGALSHIPNPEIAHEDDRDVAKAVAIGRIQTRLTEVRSPALLHAMVHACQEGSANEGHFVHDQELDVAPNALEISESFPIKLAFQ